MEQAHLKQLKGTEARPAEMGGVFLSQGLPHEASVPANPETQGLRDFPVPSYRSTDQSRASCSAPGCFSSSHLSPSTQLLNFCPQGSHAPPASAGCCGLRPTPLCASIRVWACVVGVVSRHLLLLRPVSNSLGAEASGVNLTHLPLLPRGWDYSSVLPSHAQACF